MGVFDELKRMSDGEIVLVADKIKNALMKKDQKSVDEERRELEEYFEDYLKKGTYTDKDKAEYEQKKARFDELEEKAKKLGEIEVPEEYKDLTEEELKREEQKIRVYIKVKDILAEAEAKMNEMNKNKIDEIAEAKEELEEANKVDKRMKELDGQIKELEEYFEDYMKKDTYTESDKKEHDEKQAEYDKLSEEKKNLPNVSVEKAKDKLNKVILTNPDLKKAKKFGKAIDFMSDEKNWDKIEKMSKQELKDMIAEEKQKEHDKQGRGYGGIIPPVDPIHEPEAEKDPEEELEPEEEEMEPEAQEPKEGLFKRLVSKIKNSRIGKAISGFANRRKERRQARLEEKNNRTEEVEQEGPSIILPTSAREQRMEFLKEYGQKDFEDIVSDTSMLSQVERGNNQGPKIILPGEQEVNTDAHIELPDEGR